MNDEIELELNGVMTVRAFRSQVKVSTVWPSVTVQNGSQSTQRGTVISRSVTRLFPSEKTALSATRHWVCA